MIEFTQKARRPRREPQISFKTKLANLKIKLTEPKLDEEDEWAANAEKQHQLLTDIAEKAKQEIKELEKVQRKRRLTITLESDQENSRESSEVFEHYAKDENANEQAMNLISPISVSQ